MMRFIIFSTFCTYLTFFIITNKKRSIVAIIPKKAKRVGSIQESLFHYLNGWVSKELNSWKSGYRVNSSNSFLMREIHSISWLSLYLKSATSRLLWIILDYHINHKHFKCFRNVITSRSTLKIISSLSLAPYQKVL